MPLERARALQYARRRGAARRIRVAMVLGCNAGRNDGRPLQSRCLPRRPARLRTGRCTRGVIGNVHAVDSYCFVIGPCDASVSPSDAAPNIARRSFYWKFPAAHFWISAIFPFRADVTTRAGAALFHVRFLPARPLLRFFSSLFASSFFFTNGVL